MLKALLTNIQTMAKYNRPVTPSKSPFFDQQWGKNAGFQKNTDRAKYTTLEVSEKDFTSQINDQILVLHRTPINAERSTFLNRVAHESVNFLTEQRAVRAQADRAEIMCRSSMTALMEQVFEILKAYAYELNNAVGFSPLHMAATNPQAVMEITKFDKLRNPLESITLHRARLSTSRYSLVLRGDQNGIEFYLIPVSRAIGLSKQELNYSPVAAFKTRLEKNEVVWESSDDKPLGVYHVETTCMELFRALVERTKTQVTEEEEEEEEEEDLVRRRVG
ncbi:MAG: hypothetical protein K2W95_02965 [Candidatus Obscuribacterales bacterium]|nr:hypothetical protein [Candidatus Obscuribacterales bacterium]